MRIGELSERYNVTDFENGAKEHKCLPEAEKSKEKRVSPGAARKECSQHF